ncbi:hypothetical protein G7046_g4614 [Stylonectria norvegica]|nr:hypothetical protein G7046_g4614 [Stylonectria norvegica]
MCLTPQTPRGWLWLYGVQPFDPAFGPRPASVHSAPQPKLIVQDEAPTMHTANKGTDLRSRNIERGAHGQHRIALPAVLLSSAQSCWLAKLQHASAAAPRLRQRPLTADMYLPHQPQTNMQLQNRFLDIAAVLQPSTPPRLNHFMLFACCRARGWSDPLLAGLVLTRSLAAPRSGVELPTRFAALPALCLCRDAATVPCNPPKLRIDECLPCSAIGEPTKTTPCTPTGRNQQGSRLRQRPGRTALAQKRTGSTARAANSTLELAIATASKRCNPAASASHNRKTRARRSREAPGRGALGALRKSTDTGCWRLSTGSTGSTGSFASLASLGGHQMNQLDLLGPRTLCLVVVSLAIDIHLGLQPSSISKCRQSPVCPSSRNKAPFGPCRPGRRHRHSLRFAGVVADSARPRRGALPVARPWTAVLCSLFPGIGPSGPCGSMSMRPPRPRMYGPLLGQGLQSVVWSLHRAPVETPDALVARVCSDCRWGLALIFFTSVTAARPRNRLHTAHESIGWRAQGLAILRPFAGSMCLSILTDETSYPSPWIASKGAANLDDRYESGQ